MNIDWLREQIDKIDEKIVELINKRAEYVSQIGKIKRAKNARAFVPEREAQVYKKVIRANKGPLSNEHVRNIYKEIMSASIHLEHPIKISYLGPPYSFTHLAAEYKFGSSLEYVPQSDIPSVFKAVAKKETDYGVVPAENSSGGIVDATLDMFIETQLKICSEVYYHIRQNLISKYRLEEIKKVYSHPQGFLQCKNWLQKNLPDAQLVETESTAMAVRIISKEKYSAAIGSKRAAEYFNVPIVVESIEDNSYNVTRFFIISHSYAGKSGNDKTTIMCAVKDEVGALYNMLLPFKRNGVNLTKIESRPYPNRPWEYMFFIEMEGHCEDKKVAKALKSLNKYCKEVYIIGSYPVERRAV